MKENSFITRFFHAFFDPGLDIRAQAFHLIAFGGIASGMITGLSSLFANAGTWGVLLSFSTATTGLALLLLAWWKKRYRLCYLHSSAV